MKILVTSGGTSEAIDKVRSITNHSTGHLGKIITERLLKAGHEVSLVTTKRAVKPAPHDRLNIHEIENTQDLYQTLKDLVPSHQTLIHSMAVSDYRPVYMAAFDEVAKATDLAAFLEKENQESKISSQDDVQVLFLKKTPKIISLVKDWNPKLHLIGFKLLVDVDTEHLLSVAQDSLQKNRADIIVANDLTTISNQEHRAYLVEKDGYSLATTKQEIADLLLEKIQKF